MEIDNSTAPNTAAETTQDLSVDQSQDMGAVDTPSISDIDGLSEFKFQNQSYTPEKLAKIFHEHKQYAESHQKYSQYDDYVFNLEVDVQKVIENPELAEQFKATYPKSFHAHLDQRLRQSRPAAPQTGNPQGSVPKEFLEKIQTLEQKLAQYDKASYEAAVEKERAQIQSTVMPMFEKYEYADKDAVFARAQALSDQNYEITKSAWERLIKENHLANQKRFEQVHQTKLKKQLETGQQAKDVGPGGSAPGQAPAKKPSTFKEATEEFIRQLNAGR